MLLGALKVTSYMTVIIPLVMLAAKALFRASHTFHAKKLDENISISEETTSKIQSLIKDKKEEGVHYYSGQDNHWIFSLDSQSDFIFKMKRNKNCHSSLRKDDSMKARFKRMEFAKTVCDVYQLGNLVIPRAKLFSVNVDHEEYEIIAEEKLNINPKESIQEKNYRDHSSSLKEAIRQLTFFIAKTGFSDVEWRNIPMIDDELHNLVGLIDIEEMDSAQIGLFGGINRRGLVECVGKEEIEVVLNEAKKQGVYHSKNGTEAKERRLEEITSDKKLEEFYQQKGIVRGDEKIVVAIDSLGLDLEETGEISVPVIESEELVWKKELVKMKQVIEDVVAKINELIQEMSESGSLKRKRCLLLDCNDGVMMQYNRLGRPMTMFLSNEERKKIWLRRVIDALVEKGYLFKLNKFSGNDYFIQA